jgi:hypothetical protein
MRYFSFSRVKNNDEQQLLRSNSLICIAIIISRLLSLGNFGERKLNLGDSRMEILLKAQVTLASYFCLLSYLKS